jgi:hypothetical protein
MVSTKKGENIMNKRHFLGLIFLCMISVLLLIIHNSSFAQNDKKRGPHVEGGPSGIDFMNQFDLDKDGKISHSEWEKVKPTTAYRKKHWPQYDKNRDWSITLEEAPLKEEGSEPAPPEEKKFSVTSKQIAFIAKYDKDKDLKVSNKEFTGPEFSTYDKNGNGYIEPSEAPKD